MPASPGPTRYYLPLMPATDIPVAFCSLFSTNAVHYNASTVNQEFHLDIAGQDEGVQQTKAKSKFSMMFGTWKVQCLETYSRQVSVVWCFMLA